MGRLKIFIQYPMFDSRILFKNQGTLVKPSPNWENPLPNKDFLQYFGHLRRRRNGGHDYFHDESYFIGGKGGIKFPKLESFNDEEIKHIECLYRRVLNDANGTVRYEIGFEIQYLEKFKNPILLTQKVLNRLIKLVCNIPMLIKNLDDSHIKTDIANVSTYISQLYEKATKITDYNDNFVKNCPFCVMLEYNNEEFKISNNFNLTSIILDKDIELSVYQLLSDTMDVKVFLLHASKTVRAERLRQYRIGFLRLYSEHQCFSRALHVINNPNYLFDNEKLNYFFNTKTKFLNRNAPTISKLFQPYFDILPYNEINILEKNIETLRLQIKRKTWELFCKTGFDTDMKDSPKAQILLSMQQLIARDEIDKCFTFLEPLITGMKDNNLVTDFFVLKASYYNLRRDIMQGVLMPNEQAVEKNKLNVRLLHFGEAMNKMQLSNVENKASNYNILTPNQLSQEITKLFFSINNKYKIGSTESYKKFVNELTEENTLHEIQLNTENSVTFAVNEVVLVHLTNKMIDDDDFDKLFTEISIFKSIKISLVLKFGKKAQIKRKAY